MEVIADFDALDRKLAWVDEQFAQSDDAGRAALASFTFEVPRDAQPADPFSDEFRAFQMSVYHRVSGRDRYASVENEHFPFPLEDVKRRPYPYCTASPATVGDQLLMQGWLVKHLGVAPPARLIEFGPGWGNTTLTFALMGYEVTAVEVAPPFGDLLRHRAAQVGVDLTVTVCDMLDFEADGQYDVAVFFESFHHCSDHLRMLQRLSGMMADGGRVVFAGEPIHHSFPFPWGVRLDGFSAWSIRRWGWLELGFRDDYFADALRRAGWATERHTLPGVNGTDVIVATRADAGRLRVAGMALGEAGGWAEPQGDYRFTLGSATLGCHAGPGVAAIEVDLANYAPFEIPVTLRAGDATATFPVAPGVGRTTVRLPAAGPFAALSLECPAWCPAETIAGNGDTRRLGVAVFEARLLS